MRFFSKPGDSRYALILRALIVCTTFVCLITLAWRSTPIVNVIYAADRYYIAYGITLYFAILLVRTLRYIMFVGGELELVKKHLAYKEHSTAQGIHAPAPADSLVREVYDALKRHGGNHNHDEILDIVYDTLDRKVAHVAQHAKTLIHLGFIGTLVGIMMALTEADLTSLFQPNANVGAILDAVIGGMKVAIGTSIVGIVAKIWIDHLGIILEEGSHHLANNIVKMELLDETQSEFPLS
ncbi:hypothetical protein A3C87_00735 [Candidatus Kaiserbacteria bacterium RIFCSPHIGHO2_02_FULL_49_34]|uniref:MotA/TolQ/ExbB proton channel domain-containing protein n=1 Tax=Candidatus Kaiserbacteria bacterium RIFCSPHIGHO2_02_FULL_49_34 TaxID=1798491 RepID=A0A1F6DKQ6_9BACT|nr:MAG: hypothetical protein A3C87_00735 [Candidatus Kaiserbacteria bacterium RIFCSPHIGHO2_02_FULL_49_34]